jgi:GxxExxY protein
MRRRPGNGPPLFYLPRMTRRARMHIPRLPPARPVIKCSLMLHEQITRDVIGAAMPVLNKLKPGLDEKLYENALVLELQAHGHVVEQQKEFPVHYRGHLIGKLIPDLIVDRKVIADPKVAAAFNDPHIAQMIGYLNITGLEVALLLNFKHARLDWKRVVNDRNHQADCPDLS